MPNYTLVLDETGKFNFLPNSEKSDYDSFVGGVLFKDITTEVVKNEYRSAYEEEMLNTAPADNVLLEMFHFRETLRGTSPINNSQWKKISESIFKALSGQVVAFVRSRGKPAVPSNNQHWWLEAVLAIVQGILEKNIITPADSVAIDIAARATECLGIVEPDSKTWSLYHEYLQQSLLDFLNHLTHDIRFTVTTNHSPNKSFLLNSADVAVAGISNGLIQKWQPESTVFEFQVCSRILPVAPATYFGRNDFSGAIDAVIRVAESRVITAEEKKVFHDSLTKLLSDRDTLERVLAGLVHFLDAMLERRGCDLLAMKKLQPLIGATADFLSGEWTDLPLLTSWRIRFCRRFLTFDTHAGATTSQWIEAFTDEQQSAASTLETLAERWQNFNEIVTARAQIEFNAYNFNPVISECEKVLSAHLGLKKAIAGFIPDGMPDEQTAALAGTIGQAFGFAGNFEKALHYLTLDRRNTIPDTISRGKVDSYLIALHVLCGRVSDARQLYREIKAVDAIEAFRNNDYVTKLSWWEKTDLLRLVCAIIHSGLAVPAEINAALPSEQRGDYPLPLVMKWYGVYCTLAGNKQRAIDYLISAAGQFSGSGEFTIRTLALSPVLMLDSLGQNGYSERFCRMLEQLKSQCPTFSIWAKEHLSADKTEKMDFWQRATALPFYYS